MLLCPNCLVDWISEENVSHDLPDVLPIVEVIALCQVLLADYQGLDYVGCVEQHILQEVDPQVDRLYIIEYLKYQVKVLDVACQDEALIPNDWGLVDYQKKILNRHCDIPLGGIDH